MSTIGAVNGRGLVLERTVIRVGRALVTWGEHRERLEQERQALYRRQEDADRRASARAAAVRSQLLP